MAGSDRLGKFAAGRELGMDFAGGAAWAVAINGFVQATNEEASTQWFVTTPVFYAPFQELSRPHWRPAAAKLAAGGQSLAGNIGNQPLPGVVRRRTSNVTIRNGKKEWELWFQPEGSYGEKVAKAYRDQVKTEILARNIFDTGAYHSSIQAADSINKALAMGRGPAESRRPGSTI